MTPLQNKKNKEASVWRKRLCDRRKSALRVLEVARMLGESKDKAKRDMINAWTNWNGGDEYSQTKTSV